RMHSGCFHFIPAALVAERYCGNWIGVLDGL
ncbi:MAG: hypothetical protein ACJAQ3_003739, partial [Planctomycetota bacterium]